MLTTTAADAQPTVDRAKGEALFSDAKARVDAGDFDGGCPLFEQSLSALPSASTAIHVARCHEHFGRLASALASYRQALALNPGTEGDERQKALEEIATKGAAEASSKAPKLRLAFDAPLRTAPKLTVTIDGVPVSADGLDGETPVDPGEHVVVASAEGFTSKTLRVTGRASEVTPVRIALEPVSAAEPDKPADVIEPPHVPSKPSDDAPPVWSWVVGGAGIALVGAGVGLLVDSRIAEGRLDACESYGSDDLFACPTEDYPDLESIESDIDRADIGLGVGVALLSAGAVGVAIGAVGLAIGGRGSEGERVSVTPLLGPGFAGFALRGAL